MIKPGLSFCIAAISLFASPAICQQAEPFVGAHGATVPATYEGGEGGGTWHLDLWPDQGFHLRWSPADGDGAPESFAGRWHANGEALVLDLGAELLELEVRNAERMRPRGAPEDATDDLVTDGSLDPATISLPASGMFTYFADAPTFVHCATGRMYPVAQEGDYLALEAAYLNDRPGPADPLFVTIDATIAPREQMEGPTRLTVIVDRYGATWPGEDCASAAAAPSLTGTVWRIRSLDGEDLAWAPPAREPFLTLRDGAGRFNASVGCNTMMGGFSADRGSLNFTLPASTMMSCPDDLAAWEVRLADVLGVTAGQVIAGRTLRLLSSDGTVRAELEAVYLP